MLKSYKWLDALDGMGLGWKSLKALILRAPLCGANNIVIKMIWDHLQIFDSGSRSGMLSEQADAYCVHMKSM